MPLTPADVHNVAFSKPPIGKRGYNEDEVDAFLDLVEQELARLIEENADLRQRVGELDAELAEAKKGNNAQVTAMMQQPPKSEPELPKRMPEPKPPAPAPPPPPPTQPTQIASAMPSTQTSGDANVQAAKVLGLAQEMADRLTNDAKVESEQLMNNARTNSERLVTDARVRSEAMIGDARQKSEALLADAQTRSETQLRQAKEKADALQADAERKHTEIMATINQQRSVLEGRIEQLKTFEREYRVRLKSYLESQLEELENRGSAVPTEGGDAFADATINHGTPTFSKGTTQ
ncbi:DivIVA domain-containing protein [Skermania piniformis]|uniref:Cell wall synthesis protein Wag31 n=1 Tax=Skermania pinensis TaxID=39122 RepID=A0ABX8SB84_9ACTN|nr:DivIVA domain-containing protein [Skermania piniformis]QXQ15104.1 DivIVA domain-containing protein [Skermania piniformis]